MKNKKLLIGAFIASAVLFNACNKETKEQITETVVIKPVPKICLIQGETFKSPFEGKLVEDVEGIITGIDPLFSKGVVTGIGGFYLQAETGDGNPKTSDAIYVRYVKSLSKAEDAIALGTIKVGNKVKLNGTVKEYTGNAAELSETQIDLVTKLDVISKDNKLPEALVLDKVPTVKISTWKGDLNLKTTLNLAEGIDYFESTENMRVSVNNGILTDVYQGTYGKSLYLIDPNVSTKALMTGNNGIAINATDMNPEIIPIMENYALDNNLKPYLFDKVVKQGGSFTGKVEGIMKNKLGYQVYFTGKLPTYTETKNVKEKTLLNGEGNKLTIASYNVENLFATASHMDAIALSIVEHLNSPDIIGLIEIQDNDGETTKTGSAANLTLDKLVAAIKTAGGPDYKWINIDPEYDKDGGAPGGNIRVCYIYDPLRVKFEPVGNADYKTVASVNLDGTLNANPVRIGYGIPDFDSSRKSLVSQFTFIPTDEKITVIGNHLNSKSGDPSQWGAVQPVIPQSVTKRINMAKYINNYVDQLIKAKQKVVLLGDFNEFYFEDTLKVFDSTTKNLMMKLTENERYTYSFKGNSQTLDHMLVSPELYDKATIDIVHMNAGFIDQISDHDPVVSLFDMSK